jgi:hypothetical protein
MSYVELGTDERQLLQDALLRAFPSKGALEQVTYFQLGTNLNEVAGGDTLMEIVQSLIQWADAVEKTPELVAGARKVNAGNSKLREFEEGYKAKRAGIENAKVPLARDPGLLTKEIRDALRENLLKIPQSSNFDGRSAYLIGLP